MESGRLVAGVAEGVARRKRVREGVLLELHPSCLSLRPPGETSGSNRGGRVLGQSLPLSLEGKAGSRRGVVACGTLKLANPMPLTQNPQPRRQTGWAGQPGRDG